MTLPRTKFGLASIAEAMAIDSSGKDVVKAITNPVRENFPRPVSREKYFKEPIIQPVDLTKSREKAKINNKFRSIKKMIAERCLKDRFS